MVSGGSTMTDITAWHEVESEVYRPERWFVLSVGTLFLLAGAIAFLTIGGVGPPGLRFWVAMLFTGVFALMGGTLAASALGSFISPARVHHAALDVLPNVPKEPVLCEGSVVYGRLTHELSEDAQGWQFRPAGHLWRSVKGLLFGFGIPFLVLFSGLLTWIFHSQLKLGGWALSAACGIFVAAVCGGSAFLLLGMIMRTGYRRLSRLTIPGNGNDLELDSPEELSAEEADLTVALRWVFLGETNRHRLRIPRDLVVAVQLCPWKYVVGDRYSRLTTWAVQGLLVLASSEEAAYHRLPILLTSDFVGAARLMERFAHTLQVPYLFCADAKGWRVEKLRAKGRPPLRIGGSLS
jgi:hypothetical protein